MGKEDLPVDGQEVATKGKIANWQYLQRISKMACQENDINVVVLIGANLSKAIEPGETIPKKDHILLEHC